ncbi:2-dehydro-3-deoxy-D-gluconate 5-dehydrogenase KduD [Paremcibacter congregatus]|uniref:2-dehydro-3-deoxy-D-gluconate 5-dehydrogenase KduD n=1 Tax=Paremcibacter congregatus TaxID=2043170 RepID=UPI003A92245C
MILDKFNLTDKVAIVTGASRGLGQAMALGLAEAGADIVAISTDAVNLQETEKLIHNAGRRVVCLSCDVSDGGQIQQSIKHSLDAFGKVDILVNNAGIIRRTPAHDYSDEDWGAVINTNLTGTFRFCREVGKMMLVQGHGKIINIASLLSFSGGISVPAYAASKGGVAQLTKALANEWAAKNIQVNAIAPGYFATDNTENIRNDQERFKSISDRIPTGRWGNPEDIAGAAVFLSSAASDYVNGHVMLVDGGWMAR